MLPSHLRQCTSIHDISLEALAEVLTLWEAGEVDTDEVFAFAEQLHDAGPGFPSYPKHDIRAVIVTVLDALVMMYSNPTSKADIPALKECVRMAELSPDQAIQFLDSYWKTIDWNTRVQSQYNSIKRNNPVE